jgi:hypothetical protein
LILSEHHVARWEFASAGLPVLLSLHFPGEISKPFPNKERAQQLRNS